MGWGRPFHLFRVPETRSQAARAGQHTNCRQALLLTVEAKHREYTRTPRRQSPDTRRQEWPWWPGRPGLLRHLDRCSFQGGTPTGVRVTGSRTPAARLTGNLGQVTCPLWPVKRVGGPSHLCVRLYSPPITHPASSLGELQPSLVHTANPSCSKGTPISDAPWRGPEGWAAPLPG